jgi:hypothetical protein
MKSESDSLNPPYSPSKTKANGSPPIVRVRTSASMASSNAMKSMVIPFRAPNKYNAGDVASFNQKPTARRRRFVNYSQIVKVISDRDPNGSLKMGSQLRTSNG